jgi:hypothetical protein
VSVGYGLPLRVELLHGPVASRVPPTPQRPRADRFRVLPPQQRGRSGKRHKDGSRTAQALELTARALRGLPSPCCIQGSHLGRLASLGTPAAPSLPPERANEADDLTLHKACTTPAYATWRAARPRRREAGAFGQHRCNKVYGEDTSQRPYREEQL